MKQFEAGEIKSCDYLLPCIAACR